MIAKGSNLELLSYPLKFLKVLGLYSSTNGRKVFAVTILYFIPLLFLMFATLLQFRYIDGDLTKFTSNLEALGSFANMFGKLTVSLYYQKKFITLMKLSERFWKTGSCPQKLKIKLNELNKCIQRFQYIITIGFLGSLIFMILTVPLGRNLPTGEWNPEENKVLYKFVLPTQMIMLLVLGVFLIGFECMFLTFCVRLVMQFRILGFYFEQHKLSNCCNLQEFHVKLKQYIKHHIFLLKFLDHLKDFYSPVMLVDYITSAPIIGVNMYILFERKDTMAVPKSIMAIISVVVDSSLYYIPADYVVNEATKTSIFIYRSEWYSKYPLKLQKSVSFIIQRCQKRFTFSAGGLFDINSKTLLMIFRVSWSACTVMRALKSK